MRMNPISPSQMYRDNFMRTAYAAVYSSAKTGGAASGSLFWQMMVEDLPNYQDGLSIILSQNTSTNDLIYQESQRLAGLRKMYAGLKNTEWKKKKKNKTMGVAAREIHGNGNSN
ncbi:unnamed protein product [Cuscuta epithymum]|uniref:Uncharacterized protein n=1 Tax=Cuscuta epithymum TaxID=186058 RepID=A0AAV0CMQ6_9ASTE|nr:unnamed protein product [Cuscuta epithymum]